MSIDGIFVKYSKVLDFFMSMGYNYLDIHKERAGSK